MLIALENSSSLQAFIHQQIMTKEMDDPNYELIYFALKNQIIENGLTFADLLAQNAPPNVINTYGNNFFYEIELYSPLLTITMPHLDDRLITDWDIETRPDVATVFENNKSKFIIYKDGISVGEEYTIDFENGEYLEPYLDKPTLGIIDAENHYFVNEDGQMLNGDALLNNLPRSAFREDEDMMDCIFYAFKAAQSLAIYEENGNEWYLFEHDRLLDLYNYCMLTTKEPDEPVDPRTCEGPCERDCEEESEYLVDFGLNNFNVFKSIRNQPFENKYKMHGDIHFGQVNSDGTITQRTSNYVSRSMSRRDFFENCNDGGPWWWTDGDGVCDTEFEPANYRWWFEDWKLKNIGDPILVQWAEVDETQAEVEIGIVPFKIQYKTEVGSSGTTTSTTIEQSIEFTITISGSERQELGNSFVGYCDPIGFDHDTGSVTFHMN